MLPMIIICLLAAILNAWAEPVVTPKFQQIRYPATGTVRCVFPRPLIDCRVRFTEHYEEPLRFDKMADFSQGAKSARLPLWHEHNSEEVQLASATYAGEGLAAGHCGAELKPELYWGLFALIECLGHIEGEGWSRGLAMVISSDSDVPTVINPPSRYFVVAPGSNLTIQLHIHGPLTECRFVVPSGTAFMNQSEVGPSDARFVSVAANMGKGECETTLTNVQSVDAGMWWWWGQLMGSLVYDATVVVVSSAPEGQPELILDPTSLVIGGTLKATCRSPPAVPPANLTWFLDGKQVRRDDSYDTSVEDLGTTLPWQSQAAVQTFTRRLTVEDRGKKLECRADHVATEDGGSDSKVLHLHYINVTPEKPVVRSAAGHRTQLACVVDAQPAATVQWRRAGVPVRPSPLLVISNEGPRHSLIMEDTATDDFTNFTCTAVNAANTASAVVQVTGLPGTPEWAAPLSPTQLAWRVETVAALKGSQLKIRKGTGRWMEHTRHKASEVEEGWQLVTFERLPILTGQYSVYLRVRNEYGWSPVSPIHSVRLIGSPKAPPSSAPTPPPASAGGCPKLAMSSMSAHCSLSGANVTCASAPVPLGTSARLECREGYKPQENHPGVLNMRCTRRGWRPPPFVCSLDCGRRRSEARQLSVGGKEATQSEFPWHVAIFQEKRGALEPICGGTLVTLKFFVSAAHCFWNISVRKQMNATLYRAVVGKHTLAWTTEDRLEQRRSIKSIHLPTHYQGSSKRLESDISVVQLTSIVHVTPAVNVVCVDWKTTFEFRQLVNNSVGTVPGWGVNENNTMSPTLRYVDLPFVPFGECQDSVPLAFQDYLLRDKFCGGYRNRTISVCQGDSGGGFVFATKKEVGQRYYLRGVVSSSPIVEGRRGSECQAEHRSAFTKVSVFADWMEGIVFGATEED